MNTTSTERFIRRSQAFALIALPAAWLLMFVMHFRRIADFFVFRARYEPMPAAEKVSHLIQAKNHWPMIHDPHMLGYLTLPLLVLGAFGLYAAGRRAMPWVAAIGVSLSVTGTIFLGGVFGLFVCLVRGLGDVDARHLDGAVATYEAVTADHGAYGMTRRLAMLALLGIALLGAALWRSKDVPRWAAASIVAGCALFLSFWDVDNMMFVGTLCLLAGFVPVSRWLRQDA
jgi:hypothetical protein